MMRYTFDQAMAVIRRQERREFWNEMQFSAVILLAMAVGFLWGLLAATVWLN